MIPNWGPIYKICFCQTVQRGLSGGRTDSPAEEEHGAGAEAGGPQDHLHHPPPDLHQQHPQRTSGVAEQTTTKLISQ